MTQSRSFFFISFLRSFFFVLLSSFFFPLSSFFFLLFSSSFFFVFLLSSFLFPLSTFLFLLSTFLFLLPLFPPSSFYSFLFHFHSSSFLQAEYETGIMTMKIVCTCDGIWLPTSVIYRTKGNRDLQKAMQNKQLRR